MTMPQGAREHLRPIADNLDNNIEQSEAGVWNFADHAFEKTLPSGLTMDTVKQVYEHTNDVIASATWVLGTRAEQELQENSQLDSVSGRMKIPGCGEVTVGYHRELDMPSDEGEDDVVTRYGQTQIKMSTIGQGETHEDLTTLRQELERRATEVFSN